MESVYIIVENGEAYPAAYTNYVAAALAVKTKHKEELDRQRKDIEDQGGNWETETETEVDVPESLTGKTQLYIEKDINILIMKLPVKAAAGGRRSKKRATRRNN
jgi:hypothetical protein